MPPPVTPGHLACSPTAADRAAFWARSRPEFVVSTTRDPGVRARSRNRICDRGRAGLDRFPVPDAHHADAAETWRQRIQRLLRGSRSHVWRSWWTWGERASTGDSS